MEHLPVYIIPVGLPSGRLTLERVPGAVWERFPFENWHRHLPFDRTTLVFLLEQGFDSRSRKPIVWGHQPNV